MCVCACKFVYLYAHEGGLCCWVWLFNLRISFLFQSFQQKKKKKEREKERYQSKQTANKLDETSFYYELNFMTDVLSHDPDLLIYFFHLCKFKLKDIAASALGKRLGPTFLMDSTLYNICRK